MATPAVHEPTVHQPYIPEWDQNAASTSNAKTEPTGYTTTTQKGIAKPTLKQRFDGLVPPHRTYLGLKRKWFLIAVLAAIIALLVLIIGLAAGLTTGKPSGYVSLLMWFAKVDSSDMQQREPSLAIQQGALYRRSDLLRDGAGLLRHHIF